VSSDSIPLVPVTMLGGSAGLPREVGRATVFDDPHLLPADLAALGSLAGVLGDTQLVAPPVVLPDFHHKSKMELPSSVAVATDGAIRVDLTGSSVNCGMALIALPVGAVTDRAVDKFMRAVRERYPYPTRGRRELTAREVLRAAEQGAEFGVERWDAPPEDLERIEVGGRIDLEQYGGMDRLRAELPGLAVQLARFRFGTVGPTNHFVELQRVEEVLDPDAAALLGVQEGQLTLQYHGGGGVLTGEIGRLFFRRKDYPRQIKAVNAALKPWFHLRSARSFAQLRERMALYFTDGCNSLPIDGDEGRRLMLANAAAMNYGFAFRVSTYASLRRLAQETFGGDAGRLVVDSPHNSVYEEYVGDRLAVVHRHNACRAYPAALMPTGTTFATTGQAVLLPGTHRTSSYLAVAGDRSADSLHSACHGAGTVVSDMVERGLSDTDPQHRRTRRYRYDDSAPSSAIHFDDNGVNAALDVLVRNGLVRPVARMRPIAVLH
jgi:tRNA-splicing ligase RtcB